MSAVDAGRCWQVLGKVSVNLIEKVLRWDKAGRQPVTKSVDRW